LREIGIDGRLTVFQLTFITGFWFLLNDDFSRPVVLKL
jgi:hypothetical protein